jgi:hypothetical protein
VFPRNQVNSDYADVLERNGIIAYRGNEASWMYRPLPQVARQTAGKRCGRLIDSYVNLSGANLAAWGEMKRSVGLCDIPSSRYLRPYCPSLRWNEAARLRRICEGIERAAIEMKIYHLWWHPHDMARYVNENLAFLRKILEMFVYCQQRYGMQSLTMAQTATLELTGKLPAKEECGISQPLKFSSFSA